LGAPLRVGQPGRGAAELLGPDGKRWAAQLSEARTWDNRFALLGRLLTDRIAAGPMPSPELAWAWRTMRDAGADEGDQVRAVDRAPAVLRGLNQPQST
jgi:hypothetical protein